MNDALTAYNSGALDKTNTGLGNVLFQIASIYGIGMILNRKVYYTNVYLFNKKLSDLFQYDYSKTIFRNCIEVAPIHEDSFIAINEDYAYMRRYDQNFISTIEASTTHLKINGHLEVVEYFLHCTDEIKNIFSIDEESLRYISVRYPEIFDESFTCISIHFRLRDLRMPPTYYINAIKYILPLVNNPRFFLLTDDINILKNNYGEIFSLIQEYPSTVLENNLDYIDLWTMSLCKHNIICMSTFSFWGGFLNMNKDKIVLIPKDGPRFLSLIENNHPI